MSSLLHIIASPRSTASISIRLGRAVVDEFRRLNPHAGVDTLNLFVNPPPEFNAPEAAAKYRVLSGQQPQDDEARAWEPVIEAINHFKMFDRYVISSPMWNFGIPWRLKQYVDVLVQPGLTFSYSPGEGYKGLVTGKKAVLALARGGAYGPGNPQETFDYQKTYLQSILAFIGITDVQVVAVEDSLSPGTEDRIVKAVEQARLLAGKL